VRSTDWHRKATLYRMLIGHASVRHGSAGEIAEMLLPRVVRQCG